MDLSDLENLDSNNSTSANFGGQVAYLGRGVIGGEFLADFSPSLGTFNNVLFIAVAGREQLHVQRDCGGAIRKRP